MSQRRIIAHRNIQHQLLIFVTKGCMQAFRKEKRVCENFHNIVEREHSFNAMQIGSQF